MLLGLGLTAYFLVPASMRWLRCRRDRVTPEETCHIGATAGPPLAGRAEIGGKRRTSDDDIVRSSEKGNRVRLPISNSAALGLLNSVAPDLGFWPNPSRVASGPIFSRPGASHDAVSESGTDATSPRPTPFCFANNLNGV